MIFSPLALLRKGVLPLYRLFSLVSLYTILLAILGYAAIFVFYAASSAWVVPFIASSSDNAVLSLDSQLTASHQALDVLTLNQEQAISVLATTRSQIAHLSSLDRELTRTIASQRTTWSDSASDLTALHTQKTADNAVLTEDAKRTKILKEIIEKNLAAGMITKGDAQAQIIQLDQFSTGTTDSKVAETLMMDTVRQHEMTDLSYLSVLGQKTQLEAQIAQLSTLLTTTEAQVRANKSTSETINTAISTAKSSPYFEVINSAKTLHLAIVPYSSRNKVKVGDPLYDCFLGMAICREAGHVLAVYTNEEVFEHPVLRINMRGYVVKIDADEKALRSKTLAVGAKPMLF